MSTAANITDLTREMAITLVDREERRVGSRMEAYRAVSKTVGASAQWLRKFACGCSEVKEPGWSVGWQIVAAYDRLCSRIEAEAELEMQRAHALRGRFNEVSPGNSRLDEMAARTCAPGTAMAEELRPAMPGEPERPPEQEQA